MYYLNLVDLHVREHLRLLPLVPHIVLIKSGENMSDLQATTREEKPTIQKALFCT